MKKRLLFSLLSVCLTAAAFAQPTGWLYEKPFSVTNSGPQLVTGYNMALVVDTKALITAGKMQANGADIRFGTPCNGLKNFAYYIDTGINTTATVIYVQVDSLKANTTQTIYMFYGNTAATAASTLGVFPGPYTIFNNQSITSTISTTNTSTPTAMIDFQNGTYFQPNQNLLVTALGTYIPGSSPNRLLQLSSYATQFGSGNVIANDSINTTISSFSWTFGILKKPLHLDASLSYAVSVATYYNYNASPGAYFLSGLVPATTASQVGILGYASNNVAHSTLTTTAPFVYNSPTNMEGFADVRFYVLPAVNTYITVRPDTAINAAAYFSPVSKFVCPGTTVTFSATAGGLAPTYQWQVNTGSSWVNVNTGTTYSGVNLPTLTVTGVTTAMNGYMYRAYMTSTCGTGYSNPAILTVNTSPAITPVATISGVNPVCIYNNAIYNLSTNVIGGTYDWYKSSAYVAGATTTQYGFAPTANDTTIYAVVTVPNNASIACYTVPVAVTNQIHILYGSNFTPTDSIAASNNNGCAGTIVDFLSYHNVMGGTYQWAVNGIPVPGATASTYSYAPNNGDQVTQTIHTPNNGCYSIATVTGNPVVATTVYSETPAATVAGPATAQQGQQFTLYANITNNCSNYKVYWYNDYVLFDSTVNVHTLTFKKTAGNKDFISVVVVPQSPCNGVCYQTSTQSPQWTIDFTEANVGVNNVANAWGITIYPNPAVGKISVAGLTAGDKLMVYDMTGRQLTTAFSVAGTTAEYAVQALAAGQYILRVTDSEGAVKANLPLTKL